MGQPKQLLQFSGGSLVHRAATTLQESQCDACFAVVGAYENEVVAELSDLAIEIIFNSKWKQGIGGSIRCALAVIEARGDFDAILLTLADQPYVSRERLDALIDSYRAGECDIVASRYSGSVGVPAIFGSEHFEALAALRGDRGAKALLEAVGPELTTVACEPAAADIDTPQDYERLLRDGGSS
jgi:molybdenum cofactor cytidylyltransferase